MNKNENKYNQFQFTSAYTANNFLEVMYWKVFILMYDS